MKITKQLTTLCLSLFITFLLVNKTNASVILSNGGVTFDSDKQQTQFKFTLISDTVGETINSLAFDADSLARWDETQAATVFESTPWSPVRISAGWFFEGTLDSPIVFDGSSAIDFNFIFIGAENVIGNPWQISAGNTSDNFINVLNNVDLAIGQEGTIYTSSGTTSSLAIVPVPTAFVFLSSSLLGLFTLKKKFL